MPKKNWRLVIGSVLLILVLAGVEWWIGWEKLLAPWRTIAPSILALAALLTLISYLTRALRVYDYFLPATRGGLTACLKLTLLHNLFNNLLPMRSGEISFPVLMHRYFAAPLAQSTAALLWFRLMDLHALGLMALIAVGGSQLEGWLVSFLIVAWFSLPWWLFQIQQSPRWSKWNQRLPTRWQECLVQAKTGLPKNTATFLRAWFWTLLNWLVKLAVFSCILCLFAPLHFATAVIGAIGGDLTSILPIHGIAGVGTYEAGVVAALLPFGISAEIALVAAVNLHLFILGLSIVGGIWALLLRHGLSATAILHRDG